MLLHLLKHLLLMMRMVRLLPLLIRLDQLVLLLQELQRMHPPRLDSPRLDLHSLLSRPSSQQLDDLLQTTRRR